MDDASSTASVNPLDATLWKEDAIFFALADPVRRRLLFSLARSGARPAAQLHGGIARGMGAALKHLDVLHKSGLVVRTPNPSDKRQLLYALAPAVPLKQTANGAEIDFGFCLLRVRG